MQRPEQFQSTPPVAEGRCAKGGTGRVQDGSCFNPRPPLPRGDATAFAVGRAPHRVSIHAPRCRGAMPWPPACPARRTRFQSTPPVAEGRCLAESSFTLAVPVSIHAPRCRGAMLIAEIGEEHITQVSIHAPRCRGAMQRRLPMARAGRWFQSTPPVAEGRCAERQLCLKGLPCFNPRPPLPRGDASDFLNIAAAEPGFNPRPPLPRGDALMRPPRAGGVRRFNPRPPLPRGDAQNETADAADEPVSIHAPRCRGAMPNGRASSMQRWLFQSTPPVAEGRCLGRFAALG